MTDHHQHLADRLAEARRHADRADALAERLLRELAVAWTGDPDAPELLDQAGRGASVRQIAAGCGRSKSAVARSLRTARRELAARGLLPALWRG